MKMLPQHVRCVLYRTTTTGHILYDLYRHCCIALAYGMEQLITCHKSAFPKADEAEHEVNKVIKEVFEN